MLEEGKKPKRTLKVGADVEPVEVEATIPVRIIQSSRDRWEIFIIAAGAAICGTIVGGAVLAVVIN